MHFYCLKTIFVLPCLCYLLAGNLSAEDEFPKVKTTGRVYKTEPRRTMGIYFPDDWKATDRRPALLIFRCNIPPQREYFRKLGMVIIKPQVAGVNHGKIPGATLAEIAEMPKPKEQVKDTKSAIRYVRKHAAELGVDPKKIIATGTSGGADLALQAFLNTAFQDANDDQTVSHKPDALVLYCPAFDGINIWFVKTETLLERTRTEAPSFIPLLTKFVRNTTDSYATPIDHRANLVEFAAALGESEKISEEQVVKFQEILMLFNKSDWQLLHPFEDAVKMSASRLISKEPLPPTLIMYGKRDHLLEHQEAFVEKAKDLGQKFDLEIFENGGHSFMMQPAFIQPSNDVVQAFLTKHKYLPADSSVP
jgi:acetyl esterase/lipase